MAQTETTYVLTEAQLRSLLDDRLFLLDLEAAGVDNWRGYDEVSTPSRERVTECLAGYEPQLFPTA